MIRLLASLLAVVLLASVCLAADKPATDDVIYDQVRIKLADDPVVKGGGLTVEAKDGVVTLSGSVVTNKQKDRAATLAKRVKGVKQVVNNIVVKK